MKIPSGELPNPVTAFLLSIDKIVESPSGELLNPVTYFLFSKPKIRLVKSNDLQSIDSGHIIQCSIRGIKEEQSFF